MPIALKSGSLNLLEPSGSVKACNGVALPLHYKDGRSLNLDAMKPDRYNVELSQEIVCHFFFSFEIH
jgi:hypothetical protein